VLLAFRSLLMPTGSCGRPLKLVSQTVFVGHGLDRGMYRRGGRQVTARNGGAGYTASALTGNYRRPGETRSTELKCEAELLDGVARTKESCHPVFRRLADPREVEPSCHNP